MKEKTAKNNQQHMVVRRVILKDWEQIMCWNQTETHELNLINQTKYKLCFGIKQKHMS